MKKSIISILLTIIMATTLLMGCGGSDDKKTDGKVTITVPDRILNKISTSPYTEKLQKEFDELYGDEIEVVHVLPYVSSDLNDTRGLTAILMGNDAPAYINVSNAYNAKSLYNMGLTADISKYVKDNEEFKSLRQAAVDAFTYSDGAVIGYPTQIELSLLGFYNESLQAAGYNPETFDCNTWDEYYSAVEKMSAGDAKGSSLFVGEFLLWPQNWLLSNEAEVAIQNEDGTISLNFADKKVVETIEFMRKLYQNGHTNTNISATDADSMFSAMYSGDIASFTMYPQWIDRFVSQGIYPEDITLKTFPAGPSGKQQQAVHTAGVVFNSQLSEKELEAAVKYVTFVYGADAMNGMMEYSKDNSITDVTISASEKVDWTANLSDFPQQWIDTVNEALEIGVDASLDSNGYFTYICAKLPEIIEGTGDIATEMQKAQDLATNEWLNDYNNTRKKK